MTQPQTRDHANSSSDFSGLSGPVPLQDYPNIILGHGGGGKLSGELVEHIYLTRPVEQQLRDRKGRM